MEVAKDILAQVNPTVSLIGPRAPRWLFPKFLNWSGYDRQETELSHWLFGPWSGSYYDQLIKVFWSILSLLEYKPKTNTASWGRISSFSDTIKGRFQDNEYPHLTHRFAPCRR
jgi:hypothetical protein